MVDSGGDLRQCGEQHEDAKSNAQVRFRFQRPEESCPVLRTRLESRRKGVFLYLSKSVGLS